MRTVQLEMCTFQLEISAFHFEVITFHFEMNKTADFHSNLFVSWELVTEDYQDRPVKCVNFMLKCAHLERPLPGMVIFWSFLFEIYEIVVLNERWYLRRVLLFVCRNRLTL